MKISFSIGLLTCLIASDALAGGAFGGSVSVDRFGECRVHFSETSPMISCRASMDTYTKRPQFAIDLRQLELQNPPVCIVTANAPDGSADLISGEAVTGQLRNFSAAEIGVIVRGYRSITPESYFNFVCVVQN